jgi:cytochrome c oxidase subunit 3
MGLIKILSEKSWLDQGQGDAAEVTTPPQRIALRFFLGVVGVLFGLFFVAYYIRMELDDWRPMPESPVLWINTLVLFLSSIVLQWTSHCVAIEKRSAAKLGLLLGGFLTLAFIFGQVSVWNSMSAEGFLMYNNPANAFFYVLTGIHGLHLLGGLWVWTWATIKVWSGKTLTDIRLSVELCTVYWHFLLIVWLVLFALLSYT